MRSSKFLQTFIGMFAFFLLLGFSGAAYLQAKTAPKEPISVVDDETVYALLDPTGKVKQTIVVDWLRAQGSGNLKVEDIAPEEKIETLKKTPVPELRNGKLIFTVNSNSFIDLYYQVKTRKELPLEVKVSYELNGKKTNPKELAGKTGRLKVTVKLINKLKQTVKLNYLDEEGRTQSVSKEIYTPLFVIANINLDSEKFNDIKVEGGWLSVQGSKFSLNCSALPQGEAEIGFEADARNIEIPSIIISALPMLPQQISPEMSDQFKMLYDGLKGISMINSAHQIILSETASHINPAAFARLTEFQQGMAAISSGITRSASGIEGLKAAINGQIIFLDQLIKSIDTGSIENINLLINGLVELKNSIDGVALGISQTEAVFDVYVSLASQTLDLNRQSLLLAYELQSSTTNTIAAQNLINSLNLQKTFLETLTNGGEIQPGVVVLSLSETKDNLHKASTGLQLISAQLDTVIQQMSSLKQLPQDLTLLKNSLIVLRDGGIVDGNYLPGLTFVRDNLTPIANGLLSISKGLDSKAENLNMLAELPDVLLKLRRSLEIVVNGGSFMGKNIPGLKHSATYLTGMEEGIATGYRKMEEGKAYQEKLQEEAGKYDSFLGRITRDNYSGRLRFILKIEGVSKD